MPKRTVREAAGRTLQRLLRRVLAGADAAIAGGDRAKLHAMRIAVKRLRYNTEFFRALLGAQGESATDILSRLQEHLGTIADADAFELVYEELLGCLDGDDPRAFGLESRRQATRTERERALEALRSLWKDPEQRYRERLAASISAAVGSLSPKPE